MSLLSGRSLPARPIILQLCLLLAIPALPAAAQTEPQNDAAITPIAVTVSASDVVDPGRTWIDDEGLHARDLVTTSTLEGDLVGAAQLTTDLDWFGPCDADLAACEGGQDSFSTVEVRTDEGIWTGTLAIEIAPESRSEAHGILVGRHGNSDRVIVFDEVNDIESIDSMELVGRMVTLSGPIGGIHLTNSACITGPTTADGGFLGARGLVVDNGPARIMRQSVGGAAPMGVYGEIRQIGQKGNLRSIFNARMYGRHAHGSFVLAGESGPYSGMLGYGRATATLSEDPRCQGGMQITSTWIGQARFLTDPASFLAPRVFFRFPTDGAVVTLPLTLELGAEHVEIEAAGQAREGAGYLAVIVDAPCIGPGEPVPEDDQHFHLTQGETSIDLSLLTGQYRLCLQLVNGEGIAQPATDVITIRVAASGGEDPGGFRSLSSGSRAAH